MKPLVRLVPLIALFVSGCASFSTFQTAHTVGGGNVQFAVEPSWQGASAEGDSIGFPRIDFGLRYGLTDRIDIGGRAGASGVEFMGKFLFTDPASRRFSLSVAPSGGGLAFGGASDEGSAGVGLLNFTLPVLIGIGFGEKGSEVIFAPKLVDTVLFAGADREGGAINIVSAGVSFGVCLSLARFKLLPEISVARPFAGTFDATDGESAASQLFSGGGAIYQFGLGFLFGGR